MNSVTSNAVANSFLQFSHYIRSEIFPSELGFQAGETVNIVDFTEAICNYLNNNRACINLHFIWSYAHAITLNVNGVMINSAGMSIIGNISRKEIWSEQHLFLLTDYGNTFRVYIRISDNVDTPTVCAHEINGSLI